MGQTWVETETAGCDLGDVRLNRRLEAMLEALGDRPGESLPTAFQDWSNTKAAYRFFSNGNISEDKILEGHFAASALRIRATDGPILILQDTTEFSFKRSAPEKVGFTKISTGRKLKEGRFQKHAVCGLLMHASMAITPEGLPLGLTAAKFWSRSKFKGTAALKRKINPTRVPIEQKESMRWLDNLRLSTELTGAPERCVHVGDRESDIYELYCLSEELGTGFLVRSCVDRLAEDGGTTIAKVMAEVQSSGTHEVRFRDAQGKDHCAMLSVKHATMTVRPPIGKQRKYRHQNLQVIHAEEQYTSEQLQRLLADNGITCSMSRAGNVWDNSAMESFFSSLKTERTARKVYRTRDEARADVFDYIERFYNPRTRHSKLGYLSPMEFEARAMLA